MSDEITIGGEGDRSTFVGVHGAYVEGPAGPQGPTGPKGPTGPAGAAAAVAGDNGVKLPTALIAYLESQDIHDYLDPTSDHSWLEPGLPGCHTLGVKLIEGPLVRRDGHMVRFRGKATTDDTNAAEGDVLFNLPQGFWPRVVAANGIGQYPILVYVDGQDDTAAVYAARLQIAADGTATYARATGSLPSGRRILVGFDAISYIAQDPIA